MFQDRKTRKKINFGIFFSPSVAVHFLPILQYNKRRDFRPFFFFFFSWKQTLIHFTLLLRLLRYRWKTQKTYLHTTDWQNIWEKSLWTFFVQNLKQTETWIKFTSTIKRDYFLKELCMKFKLHDYFDTRAKLDNICVQTCSSDFVVIQRLRSQMFLLQK